MQYEREYNIIETKDEFISLLYTNYRIKGLTAQRRWYDLCKLFPKTDEEEVEEVSEEELEKEKEEFFIQEPEEIIEDYKKYPNDEVKQPSRMKMLELQDMKKFNKKLNRTFLTKYGFNNDEINWLDEKGYLGE